MFEYRYKLSSNCFVTHPEASWSIKKVPTVTQDNRRFFFGVPKVPPLFYFAKTRVAFRAVRRSYRI